MSLRSFSNINGLLIVPAICFGVSVSGIALAAGVKSTAPAVQTYEEPVAPPGAAGDAYYDSPLAAGTLTLHDVLEAHRPAQEPAPKLPSTRGTPSATAPVLSSPVQSSATGLMLSQGMKSVLQKVGTSATPAPAASLTAPQLPAMAAPTTLVPPAAAVAASTDASGVKYEQGQEPRSLGGAALPAAPAVPAETKASLATATVPASTAAAPASSSCEASVQKWEKTCGEAGYPVAYTGKVVGETRTSCPDGALHDIWVTNSCTPPEPASANTAKANGVCGSASNNETSDKPTENLCGQGIASAVSGDGPWTWACSGVNGGEAAACTASRHVRASSGSCGSANGVAVSSAPSSSDLCATGTASALKGSGPWTWSCKGNSKGQSESCIAPLATPKTMTLPAAAESAPVEEVAPVRSSAPAPSAAKREAVVPASEPAPAPAARVAPAAPAAPASASDKVDLCGEAAETLAYEAPERDLCRAGTASMVNGDGPWTWSCTTNEGLNSSCRTLSLNGDSAPAEAASSVSAEPAPPMAAPQAPVSTSPHSVLRKGAASSLAAPAAAEPELACGLASVQPATSAPRSQLCEGGKASAVRGSNPWSWTCSKGKIKVSCSTVKSIDGACGAANGTSLASAPFSGLCASGAPTAVLGDGPWNWSCTGSGGGIDVTCAASSQAKADKVDGACGTADGAHFKTAPSEGLCAGGMPSAVSGEGTWTWSCSGANGGSVGSCSASKIVPPKAPGVPVNGLCGAANGVTSTSAPTSDLCVSGTLSDVVGNGPWNWSCIGENGGMTVSCTAPLEPPAPIDGACGGANGVSTLVRPQSGLCAAGISGSVNGKGPWTWTCSGANGGNPASCVAPSAGKSGALPSVMTLASGDVAQDASSSAAASALVTPQLPSSAALPALDKKTIPSLTKSKAFAKAPAATRVPAASNLAGDVAPLQTPQLPDGTQPLQPPAISDSLSPAPALQDTPAARTSSSIPGNRLTLEPSLSTFAFAHGSGNISDAVLPSLDKLAFVLQSNPEVRVSLLAYADNSDSTPREARRLSLARALAVRTYLSSRNIAENRVDIHAEGANSAVGALDRVDVKVND